MNVPADLAGSSRALLQSFKDYPEADQQLLSEALFAATQYHGEQRRKSGLPFIIHPIQVAYIVAATGGDVPTVAAALLHDVVEDTETTTEQLEQRFGKEIATLVEAVTRHKMFSQREFREKVYTKSKDDYRIACIKIADRCANIMLHDQLIFSAEKHQEHLQETEEFYVCQLATIPGIPQSLRTFLETCLKECAQDYQNRK